MIIAVELTAAIDAAGTVQTFYLSTDELNTLATDTPPHTSFETRLLDAGSIGIHVFSDGRTAGKTTLETGEIIINNIDGQLDAWHNYSFDGRPVIIRKGPPGAAYPSGFITLLNGTAEALEGDNEKLIIQLRDQSYIFDKPLSQNTYGGTNVLPDGIDGTADDIKGQRKPIIYGKVFNFSPAQVNTSRLIFQYNDGPGANLDAAYDRGMELTRGADYTSQSDMETNSPPAGEYRVWPDGGCFRLGSKPSGQVTVDVTQGAAVGNRTTAQILKQIALDAGLAEASINAADVAALDVANSAVVGIAIKDETVLQALDAVASSIGAYYYIDRLGQLRVGQLTAPGEPAASFYDYNIKNIERRPSKDVNIPAWRITIKHTHNETVQNTDLAGGVNDARRSWLAQAYRTESDSGIDIKTQWLLAREIEFDSRLTNASDALAEAARRFNLYKVKRDIFDITVPLSDFNQALMDTVEINYARHGLSVGRAFRVIGYSINTIEHNSILTIWG